LETIKTQTSNAPEKQIDYAEIAKEGKEKNVLKFELDYKFKIPEYCTIMKEFVSDEVFKSCK